MERPRRPAGALSQALAARVAQPTSGSIWLKAPPRKGGPRGPHERPGCTRQPAVNREVLASLSRTIRQALAPPAPSAGEVPCPCTRFDPAREVFLPAVPARLVGTRFAKNNPTGLGGGTARGLCPLGSGSLRPAMCRALPCWIGASQRGRGGIASSIRAARTPCADCCEIRARSVCAW